MPSSYVPVYTLAAVHYYTYCRMRSAMPKEWVYKLVNQNHFGLKTLDTKMHFDPNIFWWFGTYWKAELGDCWPADGGASRIW